MARYLEEKDTWSKEEENRSPSEPEVLLPSPPLAQTKDKKSVDKGRVVNSHATVLLKVWHQYHNLSRFVLCTKNKAALLLLARIFCSAHVPKMSSCTHNLLRMCGTCPSSGISEYLCVEELS